MFCENKMKPALLVIDLQRWFLEVGSPEKLAKVSSLISNTNALSDFFREKNLPVIRILTVHKADKSTWDLWMKENDTPRLLEGTRESEEHPDIHRVNTDIVVTKTRHSAFVRTDLENILHSRNIDTVILTGFATNACVGLTAIDACERDFKTILAGDAIVGTNPTDEALMLKYLKNCFDFEPVTNEMIINSVSREE
jgi:nicotinamidase-related amidase